MERVVRDTIYQGHQQYDSIYIDNTLFVDRTADTVFVHEAKIQYKYKFLHDTIYVSKTDTVPIVVRELTKPSSQKVQVVQKERYIPPWCKYLAIAGAIAIILTATYILWKLRS